MGEVAEDGIDLDKALAVIVGALKRSGSEKLQEELERALKRQKISPEQEKTNVLFGRITASNFSLKYGLIQVMYDRKPPYDKFQGKEMTEASLRAVHILVCTGMINEVKARGNPTGEAKRQGLHELLLTTLRRFTSPRQKAAYDAAYNEDDYDEFIRGDEASEPGGKRLAARQTTGSKEEVHVAHEALEVKTSFETEDFLLDDEQDVVGDDEEEDTTTPTTTSAKRLVGDAQMQNEEERKARQHSDVFVKVYRHDRLEIRMTVDFKSNADWKNLFQPAVHAIDSLSLTSGLGVEYRPPVCLQAWDKSTWYYGYLEIDEFVRVEDGKIVEETLARFPSSKEDAITSTDSKTRTWPFTREHVQRKFVKWNKELQRQGMTIPDGKYPVGKMFINQVPNTLPSFFGDYDLTNGARRFYEGVLRTLVGSKVTKWTSSHVYKAYHRRKELVDAAKKIGVPEDQWQFVPGLLGELDCENWA